MMTRPAVPWLRMLSVGLRNRPKLALRALIALAQRKRVRAANLLLRACADAPGAYDIWISTVEAPRLARIVANARATRNLALLDFTANQEAPADVYPLHSPVAPFVIAPLGAATLTTDELVAARAAGVQWLVANAAGWRLADAGPEVLAHLLSSVGNPAFVYWDHDLIDGGGCRSGPRLTPEWNPLHFASQDFVGAACAIPIERLASLLTEAGRLPPLAEILLRLINTGAPPVRLPYILSHHEPSEADVDETYLRRKAVAAFLGREWSIQEGPSGLLVPQPRLDQAPLVSLIIPTRDQYALLHTCVEGLRRVDYAGATEIVIVDNGSTAPEALAYLAQLERDGAARIIRDARPFNYSSLNNLAVEQSLGAVLCFVNNDIEFNNDGWLTPLVAFAAQPEYGAAGALLLYPDGTVQHAGVTIGVGNAAGHAHRNVSLDAPGWHNEHRVTRRVRAVTGACLAVARDKFLKVGGFDADAFAVAFNDVDLCLRLEVAGYANVFVPASIAIHHESKSRGNDMHPANRARYDRELGALQTRWATDTHVDPYHHPNLARSSEIYTLGWP